MVESLRNLYMHTLYCMCSVSKGDPGVRGPAGNPGKEGPKVKKC